MLSYSIHGRITEVKQRRMRGGEAVQRWIIAGMIGTMLGVVPVVEAADGVKLAYIDTLKVFDQSKIGKKSKSVLDEFVKSRQKIIDLEETELKELEETLTKQASVLSADAKKAKQEDMQRKLLAYQKRANELNREIQDKKTEVLNDFHDQLQTVVQRVAEREGYSLVFDKGSGGAPEVSSLLYAKDSLSITDKVLAELDKEAQ